MFNNLVQFLSFFILGILLIATLVILNNEQVEQDKRLLIVETKLDNQCSVIFEEDKTNEYK